MIRFATIAATALACAAAAGAVEPERAKTPSGRAMLHVEMPGADYWQVLLFWKGATALDVPGHEGLVTLGSQLPFEQAGGISFDDLNEELRDAGVAIHLSSGFAGTAMVLQSQDPLPQGGVDVARALLFDAALDEDDLDWLKDRIEAELAEEERDPVILAQRTLGHAIAGHDRRLSALTNRPFKVVADVTAGDVRDWMDRTFHDAPLMLSAGPGTAAEIGRAIDSLLEGLPPPVGDAAGEPPFVFRSGTAPVVLVTPEAEEAVVMVGMALPSFSAAGMLIPSALAGGDGSRLFIRLREEMGATYGLRVDLLPLLPGTSVAMMIGTVPEDRAADVAAVIRDELVRLAQDGVTEGELALARDEMGLGLAQAATDPESALATIGDLALLGADPSVERLAKTLTATSLEDVNAEIADLLATVPTIVIASPTAPALPDACIVTKPEEADRCFAEK
jgi:zinc protease